MDYIEPGSENYESDQWLMNAASNEAAAQLDTLRVLENAIRQERWQLQQLHDHVATIRMTIQLR